ncbi:MAG TPA: aminotransferase class I/II-fold pyridoxal phosphate-dependent enzyme [Gemmatimonadaceae bacterium]|nr:aminotransferase class I/II-fold pyridoxal phosphate-dependent enzyme [Gemmatimonadaceae bacterium]
MAEVTRKLGLSTTAIHGGAPPPHPGTGVSSPIVQAVNYAQEPGTSEGLLYTRYGNTPNAERVQRRLAMLEGSEAALVLSSGMGATACAMLALLRSGDHLVSSSWIYGGTRKLFTEDLPGMGIEVTLVNPLEPRAWRRALKKTTRVIFLESPVNPTCRVLELGSLQHLAHSEGIALVVDSTFASPINFRPIEHGVDVVIHSATKYLNGHHDILAGVVCGNEPLIDEVRRKMIVWGQAPDPFACWLLERGMKTLDVRVKRQNENAMKIAEWCSKKPEIAKVHYPGLPSHPDHEIAKTLLDGFGGMMAIELKGAGPAAVRFVKELKLFTYAASLGGVDSLVIEPRYSSHEHMSSEERAKIGIPDGFLRMSIGIENAEDLIADIEQALQQ